MEYIFEHTIGTETEIARAANIEEKTVVSFFTLSQGFRRDGQVAEQSAIFQKLDTDKSGGLNLPEVKSWESGAFHVADAMQHFFEVADEEPLLGLIRSYRNPRKS